MKTLALATILLWCVLPTAALDRSARFTRYGMEQGLPQMYVTRITQDLQGFLWVATQDGLARFDGHTMVVHRARPADPTAIVGSHAHALVVARDSTLYAATGSGTARYQLRTGTWTLYPNAMPSPLHKPALTEVHDARTNVTYRDRAGRMWTATTTQGLLVTDPSTSTSITFDTHSPATRRIASNDVWALCEDRDGRMWVGTNGGGLSVIQHMQVISTFRHTPSNPTSISSDVIRYLYQDNIGAMWIGTLGGGLCQYDPYAHVLPKLIPSMVVNGVTSDVTRGIAAYGTSNLLIGLRTGILRCDTTLQHCTMIASWQQDYPSIGAARAVFMDRLGTVWIGTERNGLGYIPHGSQRISWLHSGTWTSRPFTRTISFIDRADSNQIAIGTDNGIALVDIRTRQTTWIETPRAPELSSQRNSISAIATFADDEVLLGTEFGLYRGPLSGPYTKIVCSDPLAIRPNIDIIRSITLRNQTAYVATWGGGVRMIDLTTGRETVVDSRCGLPNGTIYAAYLVDTNTLAMSCNAGLVLWDLRTNTLQRHLTPKHGAQSYEFNSWSHLQLPSGTLMLGGISGINVFRYSDLKTPPPPSIYVKLDTAHADHVAITMSAIALSATESVQFRYLFYGVDSSWTMAEGHSVSLLHRAPGEHTLYIQARYRDGTFSEPTRVSFTVHPPYWSTWWFTMMLLAGGGCILWVGATAVGRRRAARRFEAERLLQGERIRIARDLHDEVGTGLAKIVMLADSITIRASPAKAEAIASMARDVIDRVRSIVWVMRASSERLSHTIGYIRNGIANALTDQGIEFHAHTDIEHDHVLTAIQMRNIVLSLQEVTANIVRHSMATVVTLHIDTAPTYVTILVHDNGVGFDVNERSRGFGLGNIKERMLEMNSTVSINSDTSSGTRVLFHVNIT